MAIAKWHNTTLSWKQYTLRRAEEKRVNEEIILIKYCCFQNVNRKDIIKTFLTKNAKLNK